MAFKKGECSLEQNGNWKGGRIFKNGYAFVLDHGHPRAHNGKYVHEHIAVMEARLGRRLAWHGKSDQRSEVVHHINGNRLDNRLENLRLMAYGAHTKMHNAARKVA